MFVLRRMDGSSTALLTCDDGGGGVLSPLPPLTTLRSERWSSASVVRARTSFARRARIAVGACAFSIVAAAATVDDDDEAPDRLVTRPIIMTTRNKITTRIERHERVELRSMAVMVMQEVDIERRRQGLVAAARIRTAEDKQLRNRKVDETTKQRYLSK